MNKKQITKRLELSKETLRSLSERDLGTVAGGVSRLVDTCKSECWCISWDSCPPTWPC